MAIHLKIIFFGLLITPQIFCKGNVRIKAYHLAATNNDNTDLTNGLTDSEVESALEDLSLEDLHALSNLIDHSNAIEYYYDDDNSGNSNGQVNRDDDRQTRHLRHNVRNAEQQEYIDTTNDMVNYEIDGFDRQKLSDTNAEQKTFEQFREKRENSIDDEINIPLDVEYIKQLENSFPREQEQDEHVENSEKKEHIRIKRN